MGKKGPNQKFTDEQRNAIVKWKSEAFYITIQQLAIKFKQTFGEEIHETTVSRYLRLAGFKSNRGPRSKVSDIYIMLLLSKNNTISEISKIVGLSVSTLSKRVAEIAPEYNQIQIFKDDKATLYEIKQKLLMDRLDGDKMDAMSGSDIVNATCKLEDKTRLIRGEATEIVDVIRIDDELSKLDEEEKKLRKAIDITPIDERRFPKEDNELRKLTQQIEELEGKE